MDRVASPRGGARGRGAAGGWRAARGAPRTGGGRRRGTAAGAAAGGGGAQTAGTGSRGPSDVGGETRGEERGEALA